MLRFISIVATILVGCSPHAGPSRTSARTPSPGSISRNNPAGDAENPIDAALTRLLQEPLRHKSDRFKTLRVPLPDGKHWSRVRYFGYPTRTGFRYGKNPHFALGVVTYTPAPEGNDAPVACLQQFLRRMRPLAQLYDLELGPLVREIREHGRGVEAVDWTGLAKKQRQRPAKRRAKKAESKSADDEKASTKKARARRAFDKRAKAGSKGKAKAKAKAKAMAKDVRVPAALRNLGVADMAVVRASGELNALFSRERYLGAMVAYQSWPGTCLVHGFAAKVGSDASLTEKVVERWLDETAPAVRWDAKLRARPPFKNR